MNGKDFKHRPYLRRSYELLLFALIFAFLIGVVLDRTLAPLSLTIQRLIVVVALILPAAIGVVFGLLALRQRVPRWWLALVSIFLNGFFALFYLALLAIAG